MKLLITDYKLSIFILLGGGVRPAKIRKKWDLSASMLEYAYFAVSIAE